MTDWLTRSVTCFSRWYMATLGTALVALCLINGLAVAEFTFFFTDQTNRHIAALSRYNFYYFSDLWTFFILYFLVLLVCICFSIFPLSLYHKYSPNIPSNVIFTFFRNSFYSSRDWKYCGPFYSKRSCLTTF